MGSATAMERLGSVAGVVASIRARELTAEEVVGAALDALERWQPRTNAVIALRRDAALAEAGRVDAGGTGTLLGVPVLVKDNIDVAGMPTTGASRAFGDRSADRDASVVARLRGAGAIVVGKANLHELAAGGTSHISAFGPVRNPWDPSRLAGGSSGGSAAAVAARAVPLALGSDTGGSIRVPSAHCGVTGLKPTWGRLPTDGMLPLAPSLDCPGPLATSATDLALAMDALLGSDARTVVPAEGMRPSIGVVSEGFFVDRLHVEVRRVVREATAALTEDGWRAQPVVLDGLDDAPLVWADVAWPEFAEAFPDLDLSAVDPWVRELHEQGRATPAVRRAAARERVAAYRVTFGRALARCEALLLPVTPYPAPHFGEEDVDLGDGTTMHATRNAPTWFARPINLTGLPAVTLPAGFTPDGMPLGVQLVGRPNDEWRLLAMASRFQELTNHHLATPPDVTEGGEDAGQRNLRR